ncbi:MAG: non-hydrolyzing UDP-N-acetylglucosamine 2-epimerase [Candidatus Helarchaeota archaeon]
MTRTGSNIFIIMGTRPEIIKFAPIIRELKKRSIKFEMIFTNQHYNFNLSKIFFKELELDLPDYKLKIKKGLQGKQTGSAIIKIERILLKNLPKLVLVQGDTNSSLAGALAAVKLHIKIGHIEAGLRSYDFRMPEEYNRRIIDHISNYLFAPTDISVKNLENENVWGKILKTGNTIIDSIIQNFKYAEKKSTIMSKIHFDCFALITTHRVENVENPYFLKNLIKFLINAPINIVFPIHPRTYKRLKEFNLYNKLKNSKNILLLPPLGYFDLLMLMHKCKFIITDSGGIQEEATAPNIRKFTFVIRKTSDRPESIKMGFSKIVGINADSILESVKNFLKNPIELPKTSPYGDGKASKKILSIIINDLDL